MYEKLNNFLSKNKWSPRFLGIGILFVVLMIFFPIYLKKGHVVLGDLDVGFTLDGYINRILPLFNKTWSTTTFFNGTRLPFVAPIYYIIHAIGDFPSFFEKTIIFSLILSSAIGMFVLVFHILKEQIENKKYNISIPIAFIISIGSGIYYSYNPWSIIRIQHIYLLVGYALLPFIYYEILKFSTITSNNKNYRISYKELISIFLASIYYFFAIGAVHYLFFIAFLFVGWYLYISFIHLLKKEYKEILIITYRYFIFGFGFLFLIFYWFLPYIGASRIASVNPPSINTIDSISMLARYSTFKNVAYLNSYWWPAFDIDTIGTLFNISGILIILTIVIGNIFNIRNKIVGFFILWSLVFFILSTGTRTPYFAGLYKWIVFDNPLAGQLGFIFRDSNKLIGLLAFSFAVLWGCGMAGILDQILKKLDYKKKEIDYLKRIFDKVMLEKSILFNMFGIKMTKIRLNNYFIITTSIILTFILSYYFYLNPFYKAYLNHLYKPLPIPKEYTDFISYQKKDTSSGKYFYMPRYETINTPGYEFAVTNWALTKENPQRAIGAYDIHSTLKDTYNPLEGATPMLSNFYEYTDNYLEKGIGTNLNKYFEMLGIQKLIYHKDMYNLEEYENKELSNINKQGFKKEDKVGFFHIFENPKFNSFAHFYSNSIYNFKGLLSLESLFNINGINALSYANIFVNSDTEANNWYENEKKGDVILSDSELEVLLSRTKKDDLISPFDSNNHSQVFSRWAKNIENVADWKYHLKKLGINNSIWDFSLNKGFIFTYAPAMLDLEPYEYVHDKGKDIIEFGKLLNPNDIMKASDESNISIGIDRTNIYKEMPAIKGEIAKGNSSIWRIGSFTPFTVKEKNSYYFEIVVSGQNVNNIHGKVKFLDKDNKEIGLSYVSAPRFADNFKLIKFAGSFITPVGTKKMIFELNTLENPKTKSYWFLHDVQMRDMGEYTKPNIQSLDHEFKKTGKYKIFTRTFDNIAGGKLKYTIDGKTFDIETKTSNINQFRWHELGSVDIAAKGKKKIDIENIEGFNAVNVIAAIEYSDYNTMKDESEKIKGDQMIVMESENDSEFDGNIQSDLINNTYSNGKSINLNNGDIKFNFDIIKGGKYNLNIKMNKNNLNEGNNKSKITIRIERNGNDIYSENRLIEKEDININELKLDKGKYNLIISLVDNSDSIIKTSDFERLKGNAETENDKTIIKEDYLITKNRLSKESNNTDRNIEYFTDEPGCSYFAGLENDYVNISFSKEDGNEIKKINLKPGTSCFWLIVSNGLTKIEPNTEYLLSYLINKTDTKYLHTKIMYYDKDKHLIEKQELDINGNKQNSNQLTSYDLDKKDKVDLKNDFIIKSGNEAEYISIQFWQKQRQDTESEYSIKNMLFKKYDSLPGVDYIYFVNDKIRKNRFNIDLDSNKIGTMKRVIKTNDINESGIIVIGETYNPLWQMKLGNSFEKSMIVGGFLNGFFYKEKDNEQDVEILFLPSKYIIPGFIVTIITIIGMFLSIYFKYRRCKIKKS